MPALDTFAHRWLSLQGLRSHRHFALLESAIVRLLGGKAMLCRRCSLVLVGMWSVLVVATVRLSASDDPVGDVFIAPDPAVPGVSTAPDLVYVEVYRQSGNVILRLQFAGETLAADDLSDPTFQKQLYGRVDLGADAPGMALASCKSTLTLNPSFLDVEAYIDFGTVDGDHVSLFDGDDGLLGAVPVCFAFDTVRVAIPETLIPQPEDITRAVMLVRNLFQDTWDMFPNGDGNTMILESASCEPEDVDCDGDVDLADFGALQLCFTGDDGEGLDSGCDLCDFDIDCGVDLDDFGTFLPTLTGPS